MLSIASGITGHDMLEILVPMLGHAFRFATPENEWRELFLPYLPEWLTVSDSKVARGYYEGEVNLYTPEQLIGWAFTCPLVDHVYLYARLLGCFASTSLSANSGSSMKNSATRLFNSHSR